MTANSHASALQKLLGVQYLHRETEETGQMRWASRDWQELERTSVLSRSKVHWATLNYSQHTDFCIYVSLCLVIATKFVRYAGVC